MQTAGYCSSNTRNIQIQVLQSRVGRLENSLHIFGPSNDAQVPDLLPCRPIYTYASHTGASTKLQSDRCLDLVLERLTPQSVA